MAEKVNVCWRTEKGLFVGSFKEVHVMQESHLGELRARLSSLMKKEGMEEEKALLQELARFVGGLKKESVDSYHHLTPFDVEIGVGRGRKKERIWDSSAGKEIDEMEPGNHGCGILIGDFVWRLARFPGHQRTAPVDGYGGPERRDMEKAKEAWLACAEIGSGAAQFNKALKAIGMPPLPKSFTASAASLKEHVKGWELEENSGKTKVARGAGYAIWCSMDKGFLNRRNECGTLASAVLHESAAAAMRMAKVKGLSNGFVVKVNLGIGEIIPVAPKSESPELEGVMALNEEAQLAQALALASAERLRARLAELEENKDAAPAQTGPARKVRI